MLLRKRWGWLGAYGAPARIGICALHYLVPEIVSALNRRLREHALTDDDYQTVKKQLVDDVRDAIVLQLTPAVIARSVNLLEGNGLRAMDALHVAYALEWQTDLFVTSHQRQLNAAKNSGLPTEYLGVKESKEKDSLLLQQWSQSVRRTLDTPIYWL